eukprot:gene5622-6485_t
MDPFVFLTYRLVMATPILWVIGIATSRLEIFKLPQGARQWLLLLAVGLASVTINQSLFLVGLKLSTASNAAITQPAIPVFSTLFAVVFGMEKKTPLKFVGIAVAVAGAVLMIDFTHLRDKSSSGVKTLLGNLCFLGNTIAYSAFLLLQQPLLKAGLSPAKCMAWAFTFGTPPVIAITLGITPNYDVFRAVTWQNWLALLYTAIFATAYTFWASTWAVGKSDATTVAVYLTIEPLATSILAAIFLGERPTPLNIAGGVVILIGVTAVMISKHREQKKDEREAYAKRKLVMSTSLESETSSTPTGDLLDDNIDSHHHQLQQDDMAINMNTIDIQAIEFTLKDKEQSEHEEEEEEEESYESEDSDDSYIDETKHKILRPGNRIFK